MATQNEINALEDEQQIWVRAVFKGHYNGGVMATVIDWDRIGFGGFTFMPQDVRIAEPSEIVEADPFEESRNA